MTGDARLRGFFSPAGAAEAARRRCMDRGLVPGRIVRFVDSQLGVLIGWNTARISVFPAHEFPLLATAGQFLFEADVGHICEPLKVGIEAEFPDRSWVEVALVEVAGRYRLCTRDDAKIFLPSRALQFRISSG